MRKAVGSGLDCLSMREKLKLSGPEPTANPELVKKDDRQ